MRICALLLAAGLVLASPDRGGPPPGPGEVEPVKGERIAWFATLALGLGEAKRTNRPILLVSAAPHCHEVPGIW
jgi:hypothetical protein